MTPYRLIPVLLLVACPASDDAAPETTLEPDPCHTTGDPCECDHAMGCPNTDTDSDTGPTGDVCQDAANALADCGETVSDDFLAECAADLAFADECHAECLVSVEGCYVLAECTTESDIDDCVSSATNFESCLCDDTLSDGGSSSGGSTSGGSSSGGSTSSTGGTTGG